MKPRMYPLNLLWYLLPLYLHTCYIHLLMYSLYCCIYVPTASTTVPTVPTVRTRTLPTAVQYVLPTATRTNCSADVGTFTYRTKKVLRQSR